MLPQALETAMTSLMKKLENEAKLASRMSGRYNIIHYMNRLTYRKHIL